MLGDTTISWKKSKQKFVKTSTSTREAEVVALCDASTDTIFMRTILVFLQSEQIGKTVDIFGDNGHVKTIANNTSSASWS